MVSVLLFHRQKFRKQDQTKDQFITTTKCKLSAIFMPLFALTITLLQLIVMVLPHSSQLSLVLLLLGTVLTALAASAVLW